MSAAEVIKALGGRNGMARCPVHKGGKERTPSLKVTDGPDGKLLVHCKAGCSQADVWAALKRLGLVDNGEPVRHTGRREKTPTQRRAEASATWEESGLATYSPAAEFCRCRGITIQTPACIRYHAGIHALVALVQAADGSLSGIQRIYLETDSRGTWKRSRRSLGIIKGGAVRLTPVAESIQICESVEDGLSLLQLTVRPTWAVPGAGFMESFEPPPEVGEVVLAPDHDQAGLDAIRKASAKLCDRVKVRQLLPPPGKDWCDYLGDFDERIAIQEEPAPPRSWVEEFVND